MELDKISWVVPGASQALENRKEIVTAWERLVARLFGKKSRIAFTGAAGVGKTALFDCLSGRALRPDYQPPVRASGEAEKDRLPAKGKRLALTVVPGQTASTTRADEIEKAFNPDDPVDGVVHVVANGFVEIRDEIAREVLVKTGLSSLRKFREHHLAEEASDLKELCVHLRRCHQKAHRPTWLLVVANKMDLFRDTIEEVRQHYSPAGSGRFASMLGELKSQVGTDHFTWTAVPACACPGDFRWHTETAKSLHQPQERLFFLHQTWSRSISGVRANEHAAFRTSGGHGESPSARRRDWRPLGDH